MTVRIVTTLTLGLLASAVCAEPQWKLRTDPLMALANIPNLEVDRALSPTLSMGAVLWHSEGNWFGSGDVTSAGMRIDWFDRSVFEEGWHSNLIFKSDWVDGEWDRARLKGTQTYQWAWNTFYINAGIGVQLVTSGQGDQSQFYDDYRPWLIPAWEISLGRSF